MSAFLQINQQSLAELLTFIDFADNKLTIGFVCINFAKDRNTLIDIIKNHEQCKNIQFQVLTFDDTELRFLKDAIVAELSNIAIQENKKLVLIIVGLEKSIGMSGEYPPVLQDLNFVRDAFTTSVPHPILFFLPDNALTRLAKYAPDVWAWRKGVFEFKTVESTKEYAIERTLNSEKILGSLELSQKQERIDLLERLLMEASDTPNKVNILKELGVAYRSIGEVGKAEYFLQKAFKLTEDVKNLIPIRASILHEIGNIYLDWENLGEAVTLLRQFLELIKNTGNLYYKAVSLHQLAMVEAQIGNLDEAINHYQQSIELNRKIGEVRNQTASLHNLTIIYAKQGNFDEAINLNQQCLELSENISDLEIKAASLNNLAYIYAKKGDLDKAVSLYHESLELQEKIGDLRGKASNLNMLAQLIADEKQDFTTALEYLHQSLEIFEHLKSPVAETVEELILEIKILQLLKQSPEAQQLYQQLESADEDTRSEIISRLQEFMNNDNEES